jgi:hypothetical protein
MTPLGVPACGVTRELMQRELVVDLESGEFQVLPVADPRVIGPVDYGWVRHDEARRSSGRADPDIMRAAGGFAHSGFAPLGVLWLLALVGRLLHLKLGRRRLYHASYRRRLRVH